MLFLISVILKWLPECIVCFVGTIYFFIYHLVYNMYPHEIATIEALKKRGFIPRANANIDIRGWKDRDADDFNTFIPHDIYNYLMPYALFFNPDGKVNCNLFISLCVFSTSERDAEIMKQEEIEKKLDILLHSTPRHSELHDSRITELDALSSNLKNIYTTVMLTLPVNNSATNFLINFIENDAQADAFFIKPNKKNN